MGEKQASRQAVGNFPNALTTVDAFYELLDMLLAFDEKRRSLRLKGFGAPVRTEERGKELLDRVAEITGELLGNVRPTGERPALVLIGDLRRLPFLTLRLYVLLLPLVGFLFYMTLGHPPEDPAVWFVRAVLLFLLAFPLIYRRRLRLNLEHRCRYGRDSAGKAFLYMEELEEIPFQSYLAHEYAHHVYRNLFGDRGDLWFREGWCRMIQWKVCERLAVREDEPAFYHHVLLQVTGEIKFGLELMGRALRLGLPSRARRVKTIFRINSLVNFFTGTPGYDVRSLLAHSLGTSFFCLAERRVGFEETILRLPLRDSPEEIVFPSQGKTP